MTGLWNDFNDAQSNTNLIPKGTLAKVRLTIRPGGFDDPSQGWTGGYATRGSTGAVYLNGEFTVLEGPYLDGQQGAYIETRNGFDVDGVEIKCRLDFGAKAIDWRGLYKNPGA